MKRCPTCNKTFSEEGLLFCTDDGTILEPDESLPVGPGLDPMATVMSSGDSNAGYAPPSYDSAPGSLGGKIPESGPIAAGAGYPQQPAWQSPSAQGAGPIPDSPQKLFAVLSMILGLISLVVGFVGSAFCFLCGFTGVPALILGIIALVMAHKDPARYGGKVFAWVGIASGVVALLLPLFWFLIAAVISMINR